MRPADTGRVWRKSQRHAWKGNGRPAYALRYMTSPAPLALEAAGSLPVRTAPHVTSAMHAILAGRSPSRLGWAHYLTTAALRDQARERAS
jgi:hypothetical protein